MFKQMAGGLDIVHIPYKRNWGLVGAVSDFS
jgi:hypothetical protein